MLNPPSRTIALILFSAIKRCAFCTRAARSSRVIGFTSAVIGLSAAIAGCAPEGAVVVCACATSGELLQRVSLRPRPAVAPVCINVRGVCVISSPVLDERPVLQFRVRLLQLVAGVHDDGTIPRHGIFERPARHEQETNPFISSR